MSYFTLMKSIIQVILGVAFNNVPPSNNFNFFLNIYLDKFNIGLYFLLITFTIIAKFQDR